jgi:hypothetical protein
MGDDKNRRRQKIVSGVTVVGVANATVANVFVLKFRGSFKTVTISNSPLAIDRFCRAPFVQNSDDF